MILLALLVLAAILVLIVSGWGTLLLIQLGVIVSEAQRPVHSDSLNYSLRQGREVGREDEQH